MHAHSWSGHLLHIHITPRGGAPMEERAEARLLAGQGIEGDRYLLGTGTYSPKPQPERQVTLIEVETLEALVRDHDLPLAPHEHRRNLTVRDVPLNHLVGRRFRVGEAVLEGVRLNVPCQYLDDLLGRRLFKPLTNRSGLNCIIVQGGVIRPGDALAPM